jgi:hypothetical protein
VRRYGIEAQWRSYKVLRVQPHPRLMS